MRDSFSLLDEHTLSFIKPSGSILTFEQDNILLVVCLPAVMISRVTSYGCNSPIPYCLSSHRWSTQNSAYLLRQLNFFLVTLLLKVVWQLVIQPKQFFQPAFMWMHLLKRSASSCANTISSLLYDLGDWSHIEHSLSASLLSCLFPSIYQPFCYAHRWCQSPSGLGQLCLSIHPWRVLPKREPSMSGHCQVSSAWFSNLHHTSIVRHCLALKVLFSILLLFVLTLYHYPAFEQVMLLSSALGFVLVKPEEKGHWNDAL